MTETGETFTCESCGATFPKGWSDEEAAAEAEELFPGMDISDPAEAGIVCDDCYQHIMARARAEAPELIGPGWRGSAPEVLEDGSLLYDMMVPGTSFLAGFGEPAGSPQPIPDFPGFTASLLAKGYTRNPCPDCCQDKGTEHEHLRTPDGNDMIVWADGRWSDYDLTQPARLIYPAPLRSPFRSPLAAAYTPPGPFGECYQTASGMDVHVRPGCRCKA